MKKQVKYKIHLDITTLLNIEQFCLKYLSLDYEGHRETLINTRDLYVVIAKKINQIAVKQDDLQKKFDSEQDFIKRERIARARRKLKDASVTLDFMGCIILESVLGSVLHDDENGIVRDYVDTAGLIQVYDQVKVITPESHFKNLYGVSVKEVENAPIGF